MLHLISYCHPASLSLLLTLWLEISNMSNTQFIMSNTQFIYLEIAIVLFASLWCEIHMCSQPIDL